MQNALRERLVLVVKLYPRIVSTRRTRGFISQVFPEAPPPYSRLNYVKHAPFVFSVPLLKEMAEVFSEEYKSTAISHFRTYDTVDVPTLHNMYCQVSEVSPSHMIRGFCDECCVSVHTHC